MIKYMDKSNLREAGHILVHSFRKIKSVMEGRTRQQARVACWQEPVAGIHTVKAESGQEAG